RDPPGRLHIRGPDLDHVPDPDPRVPPLQPVQPDDPQAVVLRIRRERDGRRAPLPHDLDDAALAQTQRRQRVLADPRRAAPHVLRLRARHLQPLDSPTPFRVTHWPEPRSMEGPAPRHRAPGHARPHRTPYTFPSHSRGRPRSRADRPTASARRRKLRAAPVLVLVLVLVLES